MRKQNLILVLIAVLGSCSYRHGATTVTRDHDTEVLCNTVELLDDHGERVDFTQYTIYNDSDDCYYTWIDYNSSSDNNVDLNQSRKYFYRWFGDFSLCQLLTDNIDLGNFLPQINVSFLAEIKPGQSFSYFIKDKDECNVITHIFYKSRLELQEKYGVSIVNREALYKPNFVLISSMP